MNALDLELSVEALVERALAQSQDVHRRPRADPLAVLGILVVDKAH